LVLSACAPLKTPVPIPPAPGGGLSYAPQPGDTGLERDSVEIVKAELAALASYPAQYVLNIDYFTPTPCHQFRLVASRPDAGGRIHVEAYSLRKANQVCALMRLATPSQVSLNLGSLPADSYTVWLNGAQVGEFTAP
jgi:hypothetical protein